MQRVLVTVPQGVVYADKRFPGDWFISVTGADVVANFSLVTDLVESPIIDKFIPLDADKAAAEQCGRFCVVLADGSAPRSSLEDGLLPASSAPARRSAAVRRATAAAVTLGGLAAAAVGAVGLGARTRRAR